MLTVASHKEKSSQTIKLAKIALAVALFLDPVLNMAAISPNSAISNLTPARLHQEFAVEVAPTVQELSLADLRAPTIQYKPKSETLDIQEMARVGLELHKHYAFDAASVIPTDMPRNSSNQTYVANKVLQHALEQWYKAEERRHSEFIRAADSIGSGIDTAATSKSAFRMKVRPATGQAQLSYEGQFKAQISFDALDKESKFEVTRTISNKEFVFNTINNAEGVSNQIGVRWNF